MKKIAEADNVNGNSENTAVKKRRGRPVGSKSKGSPKVIAQNILKRQLTHALNSMSDRKDKPLHQLIDNYLTEDIGNIQKFSFLFPKESNIDLKSGSLFSNTLSEVASRIKDYKKPSLKEADVVTIDNNITDIESD
tara:strand:- start:1378 stop:1785 length:408 start_codon:yes stop_codon:yes gene_type:complete